MEVRRLAAAFVPIGSFIERRRQAAALRRRFAPLVDFFPACQDDIPML